MQQLKLLNELYQQRFLGIRYFNDLKPILFKQSDLSDLPSNLQEFETLIHDCSLCNLFKSRKNIIFGEGNPNASLMFVSDVPTELEDSSGSVFVGRAGEMLDRIIENVLMMQREDIYIANILKCRPSENRPPNIEEVKQCLPFLMKQIEIIKPKIIVALGITSYSYLTGDMDAKITDVRGEMIDFGDSKLINTFHPNYLLRNPSAKKDVQSDMLKVKAIL